jgi:hypothetical protein
MSAARLESRVHTGGNDLDSPRVLERDVGKDAVAREHKLCLAHVTDAALSLAYEQALS